MVLDRNPKDYFAEVEQIAFSPAHMVPGIEASPDKMLQVQQFLPYFRIDKYLFFVIHRFRDVSSPTPIPIATALEPTTFIYLSTAHTEPRRYTTNVMDP